MVENICFGMCDTCPIKGRGFEKETEVGIFEDGVIVAFKKNWDLDCPPTPDDLMKNSPLTFEHALAAIACIYIKLVNECPNEVIGEKEV